jgi:catechol 2,3-dioxygenase-like lactoylglutathione lyase family enzyme
MENVVDELSPITLNITFLHTDDLSSTRSFYSDILGFPLARDQDICLIFKINDGAFLGFCTHIESIQPGRKIILTFVTDDVDQWYAYLSENNVDLVSEPELNTKFNIYHFFFKDPNGYWFEIQKFLEPL